MEPHDLKAVFVERPETSGSHNELAVALEEKVRKKLMRQSAALYLLEE